MRISDWSSDVCSSDLGRCLVVLHVGFGFDANLLLLNAHRDDLAGVALGGLGECADICHVDFLSGSRTRDHRGLDGDGKAASRHRCTRSADRKSVVSGKSVSVRVDIGGRRILKKKKKTTQ